LKKIKNYIGGILTTPYSSNYINNHNPASGEVYTMTPDSGEADVELAVESAEKALPEWSATPIEERCSKILWIAKRMRENITELALAESNDTGKPLWLVNSIDIPGAIKNLEFFAISSESLRSKSKSTGIVCAISSWNLPLFLFTWKIIPALVTGNCVIAKPSELTPMTAYMFSELCIKEKLPDGVLNVIHGYGDKAGSAIVSNPKTKAVTISGSTKTGMEILKTCTSKNVLMELGGRNASIIFKDCNYDNMLETMVYSSFSNHGENCLGCSRLFVENSIYDRFREDFVGRVRNLKIGDPLKSTTHVGAVISKKYIDKSLLFIESAKEDGGDILCGGSEAGITSGRIAKGFFFEPTVIDGLDSNCNTQNEDIYGPIITLTPFEKEEKAIQMTNDIKYGFTSIIWTEDLKKAQRVASKVKSGIIWMNSWMLKDINTPYQGIKEICVESGGVKALKFFA
jgi:aminomuconate-semialdehyde/2-hydroxymuconate-6-semialdehyde dehydrogenase